MINNQTISNNDQRSSEINNDSTNDNIDNKKDEFLSNNNDDYNKETINRSSNRKVPKPDDERTLFVRQLSSDITKQDLQKHFSNFGSIENITIKCDESGERARHFAFILFNDKEAIQKALTVQLHTINRCRIVPKQLHPRRPVTYPTKTIYIRNFPTHFVEHDLSNYFSQFGSIEKIELRSDHEKSIRRPYGFVKFSSEKVAEEVLRQRHHSINGGSIEVIAAKQPLYEQQYQCTTYIVPHAHNGPTSPPTTPYQSKQINPWSQGAHKEPPFWNTANTDIRNNNNNTNSIPLQSTGCDSQKTVNLSVDYLNGFKRITLKDGRTFEPIGMKLIKLSLEQYKEFHSTRCKVADLNLAERMTVLVGPNSCGKTTVLQAVHLFCHAVKRGSGKYSPEEMIPLFGTKNVLDYGRLSGLFEVFYKNFPKTKKLKLRVTFGKNQDRDAKNHNDCDLYSYVFVTVERHEESCLFKEDYGDLEKIFPSVKAYDSKSMLTGQLDDIFDQYPSLGNNLSEINSEMQKVFPQFEIGINSVKENDDQETPKPLYDNTDDEQREKRKLTKIESKSKFFIQLTTRNHVFSNISGCSDGFLRYLTLLTAILCQPLHSIITIDEPDAHIFPIAQKLLIEFFYSKMKQYLEQKHFCQIIFTTHSPDIMQVVELEDIRQIFPVYGKDGYITIKSLANTGHLLNAMTDVGSSILSHGEFVRLAIHRKLLYLESYGDYDFLSGIIHRSNSKLLTFPFTKIEKGGRPTPSQIKELISQFRKFLPKEVILHIFVLVDADLRSKNILDEERKEYDKIQTESDIKAKIYYHCWAVREWENWLLYNEDLLYEMLSGDQLGSVQETKELPDEIEKNRQSHCEFTVATNITTASVRQNFENKEQFDKWFIAELHHHSERLLVDLNPSQMQGIDTISKKDEKQSAREKGFEFLRKAGVTVEMMGKFGNLENPILTDIGSRIRQQEDPKRRRTKQTVNISDDAEKCHAEWLTERKLQQPIDCNELAIRKELTKWIDAKLFFHQLTHGRNTADKKIDLDKYWKQAFSSEKSGRNDLYGRYFGSLDPKDPQKWPEDFEKLLQNFGSFINAP